MIKFRVMRKFKQTKSEWVMGFWEWKGARVYVDGYAMSQSIGN